MSETQNEYETESETDVEPTPFASAPWEPERPDESAHAHVWGSDGDLVATVCDNPVYGETAFDRARLIAAAGTAAEEAKEMGYDPVAVQKALPKILEALEDTAEMMDHPHAPGHAARRAKVNDALASAEGSGDE